jgi:hypothetical protein
MTIEYDGSCSWLLMLAAMIAAGSFLAAASAHAQSEPAGPGAEDPAPLGTAPADPLEGAPGDTPPDASSAGFSAGGVNLEGESEGESGDVGDAPPAGVLAGRPTVSAVRAKEAPSIDGRLDDSIWRSAARLTEFVQQRPLDGAPATERTEVFVAFDNQRLYFGIYAHYSDPSLVRANRVDRDRTENDDTVTVIFDPFLDQQGGYALSVNGYGVQGDSLLGRNINFFGGQGANQQQNQTDRSWNVLFASAGQLVEDGWTAEMAIPFKSLRYPSRQGDEAHRWGFQVMRDIQSKEESLVWAPISRDVAGFLRQMGLLEGISNLSTSRNLEILPTFTAVQAGTLDKTTGALGTSGTREGGVNLKYGITSNLTLDFTYNPDFSQIESDRQQIEVNQRFPINYPELRPFFLEGQDIFRLPGPGVNMVHTRTIVDPQIGAKITGKVGRTTLGVVVANDQAPGRVDDRLDRAFGQTAKVLIGRASYELYSESSISALVTDREFLDSYSRAFGYQLQLRLGQNHRSEFKGSFTDHRDMDGLRKTGQWFEVNVRREGQHLSYVLNHHEIDPDLTTDLGFLRRVDLKNTTSNVTYRWWPGNWIISWGPRLNYDRGYDYDKPGVRRGTLTDQQTGMNVNVNFAKNIALTANINRDFERYRETGFVKKRYQIDARVGTSRRIAFEGNINGGDEIRFIENPYLGHTTGWEASVTLRPISRLQSAIILESNRFMDVRNDTQVFDIKILRATTTYQFTDRLLVRNILENDSFDKKLGANVLVTYRVNSGTAFYLGYDDRYRQGEKIDPLVFPGTQYRRTNRAFFTKLQLLFRY